MCVCGGGGGLEYVIYFKKNPNLKKMWVGGEGALVSDFLLTI